MRNLHLVGFDLAGLPEGFAGQVAIPEGQRANPCHLRLVRALMGQQGGVIAVLGMDDDQALADGEASGEPEQAGGEDHHVVFVTPMAFKSASRVPTMSASSATVTVSASKLRSVVTLVAENSWLIVAVGLIR